MSLRIGTHQKGKKVSFILEAGEQRAPQLARTLEVLYCVCSRIGEMDEATGKCHHCMRSNWAWPSCATRKWRLGEIISEFYVMSAGGQPIEKWREWSGLQFGYRGAGTEYQLLWRAPFSNSSRLDLPQVPRGGRIWRYAGEKDEISVRIKLLGGEYWEYAQGEERVVDDLKWYLENRRF